jgi:hypothetical protein
VIDGTPMYAAWYAAHVGAFWADKDLAYAKALGRFSATVLIDSMYAMRLVWS